jgi:hypothetical protein
MWILASISNQVLTKEFVVPKRACPTVPEGWRLVEDYSEKPHADAMVDRCLTWISRGNCRGDRYRDHSYYIVPVGPKPVGPVEDDTVCPDGMGTKWNRPDSLKTFPKYHYFLNTPENIAAFKKEFPEVRMVDGCPLDGQYGKALGYGFSYEDRDLGMNCMTHGTVNSYTRDHGDKFRPYERYYFEHEKQPADSVSLCVASEPLRAGEFLSTKGTVPIPSSVQDSIGELAEMKSSPWSLMIVVASCAAAIVATEAFSWIKNHVVLTWPN